MFIRRPIYPGFRIFSPIILGCILLLTACDNSQPANQSNQIVIGGLYNVTGAMGGIDVQAQNGALLAVKQINDGGGINGRPISFITRDGKTEAATTQQVTSELLAQNHPAAIIGFDDSD